MTDHPDPSRSVAQGQEPNESPASSTGSDPMDDLQWLTGADPKRRMLAHLIRETGQMWKFTVAMVLIGGGAITGFLLWGRFDLVCSAIVLAGAAFGCLSIRFPRCRAPWMWSAIEKQDFWKWDRWLISLRNCPRCGYPDPVDNPAAPHVLCPRCKQTSSNTSFCEVCGKDLRQDHPAVTAPDDRQKPS